MEGKSTINPLMMSKKHSIEERIKHSVSLIDKSSSTEGKAIGIIRPTMSIETYDIHRNLGTLIFGHKFRPSIKLVAFLDVVYSIGGIISCFALWNFIPRVFVYSSLLCWPHLLYDALIFNIDKVKYLLREYQTITSTFWSLVLCIMMLVMYENQEHAPGYILFWIMLHFSFQFMIFFE